MLPEWMIDVPDQLPQTGMCKRGQQGSDALWYRVMERQGARTKDSSGSAQSYSILDCIFHELDQTYYVLDMVCWREYSLYDCKAEFRFLWLSSKLAETSACVM
nr:snurportin-1 [Quercus suber]